ncbi:hypothetical protein N7468_008005 [Penicillium chermesinum]|uniref:5'-3' DNA helicase ZGRF1-like N-terminal domain-containing protein n=1 Tax=Penicillium chermesinum TaxID=63820 RepID=A0A9W9NR98_9EURO|nr:uncharacterized protein N7468_008005 [Penicillium chermesinum]KAJ5223463.1 hypothetical protein N7468_008005 [Penicillium chermesinum]
MSTPSSTARSAVTPQVTASVIKFQCLYTHDLRRKSKRWQDGYLKFHSFNKRVMVYDDSGTFVGDHHWRSAEEVQDGDELELDKGVLIEVGERLSTTQTDITNLFDKKKSSQASPARGNQNPLQSQAPRISTAPTPAPTRTNPPPSRSSGTSQTFRSLNDLLGIKKNQPPAHPHGERPQPQANIQGSNEPAQKRQKVAISACTTPPSREDVMPQRPPATSITARPPPIKPLGPRPPDIPTSVGTKRKRSSEVVDLTELDDEPHTTTGNAPVQPLPQNSLKSPMPPPQENQAESLLK